MATFLLVNDTLSNEMKINKNELNLIDVEEIFDPCSDSPLFALLGSLHLKPRVEEKREPSKEFVERTRKLRLEQEELKWKQDHVGSYPTKDGELAFGQEIQAANRQLTVVVNIILTVGAAFVFGFVGLQYSHPNVSQEVRLIIGMIMATVVFFADTYFLVKTIHD